MRIEREDFLLSFGAVGLLLTAGLLVSEIETLNIPKYLNPPPEQIERFGFGFEESLADSLWLRWIQDSDTCQTYLKPMEKLDPSTQPKTLGSLTELPRYKVCDTSWSFKMLDAITLLAPRFEMPYMAGAPLLAILVEDYKGATVIFDRGLEQYPHNWQLLYRAAFHFQYDEKNLPKAAELLDRSVQHGAPIWVRSLASRLYSEAGQLDLALTTLKEYRKTIDESNLESVRKIDQRIKDLEAKKGP